MASLDSPNPSFAIRDHDTTHSKFLRSLSSKEQPSFSRFSFTPPRFTSPSLHTSPVSSPLHSFHPAAGGGGRAWKPPTVACSESNVVRIWKVPEFTECGQLKTKACMVVALEVSHDRVYAAYGDGKIRVWRRTWDKGLKHVRLATVPKSTGSVRSYITGRDKTVKHMGPISSLAINVSDDILYSASLDKTVKVWRIRDFKCIETIQAHPEPVNAIIVTDDGVLYTASDDATIRTMAYSMVAALMAIYITGTRAGSQGKKGEDDCTICTGSLDGVLKMWRVTRKKNASGYDFLLRIILSAYHVFTGEVPDRDGDLD
ncbi:hypothetical protein Pint_29714 [Pistacia integerrima]|uniref:Uncharacterized protein n=1 Tax=Pistacia integerrima TaxID=434235 RepID=A0ACC0X1S4_9ROSI|nr:hypothetical protein Pint_29714 [Pistacia integerrima]